MDLDILYKLREQLKNSIITGSSLIKEDFRLKKATEDMAALSKLAPVFAQIEKQALDLPICDNPGEKALDLLALIEPVITALTTTGSGRYDILVNARKDTPEIFLDYRVFPKYIEGLGDSYSELAYLISKWMVEDGKMMIEPLKRGFDPMGKNDMYLRLEVISKLARGKENDFYLSIINNPDSKKDIKRKAIESLKYCKENIDILLEIAKTADKASKAEAMTVLKTFSDIRIDEFFEDLAKKKK